MARSASSAAQQKRENPLSAHRRVRIWCESSAQGVSALATAQRLVDLSRVESEVGRLTLGQREIDLTDVKHNRATHADMVAWSGLGWWLMGHASVAASAGGDPLEVILPPAGSAPMRFLGRTGLMTAAASRSVRLGYSDETEFDWTHLYSDLRRHRPRLPGVTWELFDELDGDQLRVVSDLESPRRQVPAMAKCGLRYSVAGWPPPHVPGDFVRGPLPVRQ